MTKTVHSAIVSAKAGAFTTLAKVQPAGALQAWKAANGTATFYWRGSADGRTFRVLIGRYDAKLPPRQIAETAGSYSITGGLARAAALAQEHYANRGSGGLQGARKAAAVAAALATQEAERQRHATLGALMDDYVAWLQENRKSSAKDVCSIVANHLKKPAPDLCEMQADAITSEDISDVLRAVIEQGKGRTANKLRAYLSAAFEIAGRARVDPALPVRFKAYRVANNPARMVPVNLAANRPDKNPLTTAELQAYWRYIRDMPGQRAAVLRLHLVSGGQRVIQLLRLKREDVSADAIVLLDSKGRPGQGVRRHALPVTPAIRAALRDAVTAGAGEFALSSDGGRTHLSNTTLHAWAAEAGAQAGVANFTPKRVRSGIETLLASRGISREVRGHLQSHGTAGVQSRHYDAYDYATEKAAALETLYQALEEQEAARIVPIRKRRQTNP